MYGGTGFAFLSLRIGNQTSVILYLATIAMSRWVNTSGTASSAGHVDSHTMETAWCTLRRRLATLPILAPRWQAHRVHL